MLRPLNVFERLVIYGVFGMAAEITFTGVWELVENGNRKLHGITSLYAFFIYGFMLLVLERLYLLLKPRMSIILRGVVYLCCCYGWEFSTGYFLKQFDACPWDYASYFRGHFMGLITAEYIPVWYLTTILAERVLIRGVMNSMINSKKLKDF
ncbi:hypothetical protein L596_014474 [Steinernema carpocapsae]|uniref:Uncharacterized protein n=1 Tax=Steinernema carpocapsae TaxID=34508 RepID=A0A4U5NCK8_STECR|nr:hypothetical protein L596_014474 [Steinernema carpocapsae]